MKKKQPSKLVSNKRARFDYDIQETVVAGIVLKGAEVKSARTGHAVLRGSFVMPKNNELWLNNMQINPLTTNKADLPENIRTRPRKLLVTKKQLIDLAEAKKQGKNIVPTRLFTDGRYIKIELGIGRGRKKYDKRELLKKRDQDRQAKREVIS